MQREVTLIFGQTGSGKTNTAKHLLLQTSRALIAETFGDYPAVQFIDYEEMLLYLESVRAFPDYESASPTFSTVSFRVGYLPRLCEEGLVFETAKEIGNLTLFLEEADRFEDPRRFPEYDEIITRGRHYAVSIVAVGLHPFKIPTELRRQATRVIAYRQIMPDDIQYLSEIVGDKAILLSDLPPFHYLDWAPSTGAEIKLPLPLI